MRANQFLRYYSDIDASHGLYTISIDGSSPEQLNGNNRGPLTQQMLWSKTNLTPGRHTLTLRQYDLGGTYMTLDFFRSVIRRRHNEGAISDSPFFHYFLLRLYSVLRANNGTEPPPGNPKSNTVALSVGIPIGLVVIVIAVLYVLYRRSRKATPPSYQLVHR